jgi:hypothetical protein
MLRKGETDERYFDRTADLGSIGDAVPLALLSVPTPQRMAIR